MVDKENGNSRITNKDLYALQEKIEKKVDRLEDKIVNGYVTRTEINARFSPLDEEIKRIKNLVYGAVATLIAVAIAFLTRNNS